MPAGAKSILLFVLVSQVTHLANGRKAFSALYFRRVFTKFGPKYVSSYVAKISSDHLAINMTMDIIRRLSVDLWLKVAIAQRETKSSYRTIFSYNMNLCSLLGRVKSVNIFHTWVENIYSYTNLPRQCPIAEGNYYWKNLRPDKDSIPAFIMTGHFRIDALFYLKDWGNAMLTNTSMFVDIKMK